MECPKLLVTCCLVFDCSVWTETAVSILRVSVSQRTDIRLYVKFFLWKSNCEPYRADCYILREVNVYSSSLAPMFDIIHKNIATPEGEEVGLVMVLVVEVCISVYQLHDNILCTSPPICAPTCWSAGRLECIILLYC